MDGLRAGEKRRGEGAGHMRENGGVGGDGLRAGGGSGRERERRGKSKPANHEAVSAYVTGAGGAGKNVMKFLEICDPASPGPSRSYTTACKPTRGSS